MNRQHHRVLLCTLATVLALEVGHARAAEETSRGPHPAIRAVENAKDGRGLVAIREDGSTFVVCHFSSRNIVLETTSKDRRWATVSWNTDDESQGSLAGSVTMHTALVSVDLRRFLLTEDIGLPPSGDFNGFAEERGAEVLKATVRHEELAIPVSKLESMVKPKAKRSR